jgi:hypothetical protein
MRQYIRMSWSTHYLHAIAVFDVVPSSCIQPPIKIVVENWSAAISGLSAVRAASRFPLAEGCQNRCGLWVEAHLALWRLFRRLVHHQTHAASAYLVAAIERLLKR